MFSVIRERNYIDPMRINTRLGTDCENMILMDTRTNRTVPYIASAEFIKIPSLIHKNISFL